MKQATQQEMIEYLDEVASAYTFNTRSIGKLFCRYKSDDGRHCAIGRRLPDDLCEQFDNADKNSIVYLRDLLPPNLKKFDIEFLAQLQQLHDFAPNWNNDGLNKEGLIQYQAIKNNILNNNYNLLNKQI